MIVVYVASLKARTVIDFTLSATVAYPGFHFRGINLTYPVGELVTLAVLSL